MLNLGSRHAGRWCCLELPEGRIFLLAFRNLNKLGKWDNLGFAFLLEPTIHHQFPLVYRLLEILAWMIPLTSREGYFYLPLGMLWLYCRSPVIACGATFCWSYNKLFLPNVVCTSFVEVAYCWSTTWWFNGLNVNLCQVCPERWLG